MKTSVRVCPHVDRNGKSCPNLMPCEPHTRPTNAPWSPDRDRGQQARFRAQTLKRDGFTCVRCQHHDPTGRTLDAHHTGSGGITLCNGKANGCHAQVDKHAR